MLTERGIGEMLVGMISPAALAAPAGADSLQCRMAAWAGAPVGVRAMLEGNRIVRIDVDSGPVATPEGVRVGDTEPRVREAYPGRLDESPHKYAAGKYLSVRPVNPADTAYRIIFETDGQRVTRFRAGQRPQVEYVERCG